MLASTLRLVDHDSQKVEVIRRYQGQTNSSDICEAVRLIDGDSYKVNALRELSSKLQLPVNQIAETIINDISGDIYKVNAIEVLSRSGRLTPGISVRLVNSISSDIYKVNAVNHLISMLDNISACSIIRDISSDVYKVSAVRHLLSLIVSSSVRDIINDINSDVYKINALKILSSNIDGADVLLLLDNISSPVYQRNAVKILESHIRAEDVATFAQKIKEIEIGKMSGINDDLSTTIVVHQDGNKEPKPFEFPNKEADDEKVRDDEKDACVVCLDHKQKTVNLPCMHSCLCFHCAKIIGNKPEIERKCPVCRYQLEAIRPFYKV